MSEFGKTFVAGHRGMVGSAIVRKLESIGETDLVLRTRTELDQTNEAAVHEFYQSEKPQTAIIAAAKVGGIHANSTYPAEFIQENLAIALHNVHAALKSGVNRLLFLGSSCIYPRGVAQPMKEDALLTDKPEPTNEAYAIAKICGLKLCEFYRQQYGVLFHSAMPTNLYGPGDYYHPENSHVIPALIRRIHFAKENQEPEVVIWGTGNPRREFLHVDDLAEGILHVLRLQDPPDWVNIGSGEDLPIGELAKMIAKTIGYPGELVFDTSKPDGIPRKLMDNTLLKSTGWKPSIDLEEGLATAYEDFSRRLANGTLRM
jgi:GDP-L-fucose synthase